MKLKRFIWFLIPVLLVSCGSTAQEEPTTPEPTIQEDAAEPTLPPVTKAPKDLSNLEVITVDNLDQLFEVDRYYGHTDPAGVVFSPDGSILGTHSFDGTVRLWDLATGFEFAGFQHPPNTLALAFRSDGKVIASGGADGRIRLWDVRTGEEVIDFGAGTWGIGWQSLDWSGDDSMIASGTRDGALRLWDVDSASEVNLLRGHQDDISGIALSASGTILASASIDASVQLWDTQNGERIRILTGHTQAVGDVDFSPDDSHLVSISGDITNLDNHLRLWDVSTGEELAVADGHEQTYIASVCFSPDGTFILSVSGFTREGKVLFYSADDLELLHILDPGNGGAVSIAMSPDGRVIATGNGEGYIQLWGVE